MKVEGMAASKAASTIAINGLSTIYGTVDMTPETIIAKTYPSYTQKLYKTGIVIMYPEDVTEDQMLTSRVPNMLGMNAIECIEACRKVNLNCKIKGDIMGICVSQNQNAGSTVLSGEVITVTLDADGANVLGINRKIPTVAPKKKNGDSGVG
jgi:stage V sporulation protein D (sporulation-specific penicillin-binding protein)